MILADTSVWIDFFALRATNAVWQLERAVLDDKIVMGDLILVEVLQGIKSETKRREVERKFATIPCEVLCGPIVAPKAAANYRRLRESGITVRGTIDVIIATWCVETGATLLHNDSDFRMMEAALALRAIH